MRRLSMLLVFIVPALLSAAHVVIPPPDGPVVVSAAPVVVSVASSGPSVGLVAFWLPENTVSLGAGNGSIVYDASGNNNHAAQTTDAAVPPVSAGGWYGDGSKFVGFVRSVESFDCSRPQTIVAKWKLGGSGGYPTVWSTANTLGQPRTLDFAYVGSMYFRTVDAGGGLSDIIKNPGPSVGDTVITAHILTSTGHVAYYNGVCVGTGTMTIPAAEGNLCFPGYESADTNIWWNGHLYWLRIYSRALSDSEIAGASAW